MIRFYGGKVLRCGQAFSITEDEVWTDGSRIAYVGPAKAEMPAFDRQIDLKGDLLIPGFKNAHTHSAMTFLRSYADDLPLKEWLYNRVFPLEAKLTPEHIYVFTKLAILEYLTSGTTACFDMYFFKDACAQACIDSGYRMVLCGAISQFDEKIEKMEDEYLRLNQLHPLITYRLGFHAEYTADQRVIDYVRSLSAKYKAPLCAHSSETAAEVEECRQRHGVTPTRYFEDCGLLEHGGTFFHCAHMTEEDLEIFRRRGLWAVTNPCSNLKLASGIAPIVRMQKAGVQLAIGTDGAASNNALDLFREMYLVSVLQKVTSGDAAACDAEDVLRMAVTGGALAMGLSDCTAIEPGMQADLAVIDLHRPSMRPLHNVLKNLVYAGSKDCVRLTMVAGRVLYEDGQFFTGDDLEKLYRQAQAMAAEIVSGA
jgi:5-methylthioadenosine/S-adenosylhomocysteine deaminase